MTVGARPSAERVGRRLASLSPPSYAPDAELLLVKPIGSWAAGCWASPHAVCLRAVFVLPTRAYLGVRSWCDEFELLDEVDGVPIDLVAFEVEKVARLVLKGHRPTLEWLAGPDALVRHDDVEAIEAFAAERRKQLAEIDPKVPPPTVDRSRFEAIDAWVRDVRGRR